MIIVYEVTIEGIGPMTKELDFHRHADAGDNDYTIEHANRYPGDPCYTKIGPATEIGNLTVIHTISGNDQYPGSESESLTLLSNGLPRKNLAVSINVNNFIDPGCVGSRPTINFMTSKTNTNSLGVQRELGPIKPQVGTSSQGELTATHVLVKPLFQHFSVTEAEAFVAVDFKDGIGGGAIEYYGVECPEDMAVMDLLEKIRAETSLLDDFSMEDIQSAVSDYFLSSEYEHSGQPPVPLTCPA